MTSALKLLAAAGVLALAAASNAHAADGWYVAAAVTGSDLNKPHQTIANAPAPGSTLQVTNDVDFGWGGAVALGRAFGPIRLEGEIGRTENRSGAYTATSPISITVPQKGENTSTRYMLNGYYDFPKTFGPAHVYLGAGVGEANVHVTTFAAPARAPNAPPSQLIDARETDFAYQLMAGFSVPLTPRVSATAQYRWFDAGTVEGRDSRGEAITRDIAGHNFDVGLRVAF